MIRGQSAGLWCRSLGAILLVLATAVSLADGLRPPRPATVDHPLVDGARDADPIDLYTGLYTRETLDFILPDVVPIVFTRHYLSRDGFSRPFGVGTTHSYELFVVGDSTHIDLIIETGGRIAYRRLDSGFGRAGAVFEHTSTPTKFYGSRLAWSGKQWDITLMSGAVLSFLDCSPRDRPVAACALVDYRDAHSRRLAITRDQDRNLRKLETPNGRWLQFAYDGKFRIVRAWDSEGRSLTYDYDGEGRLVRVTRPNGEVQEYEYDAFHLMRRIREPGIVVTNEYDRQQRVIGQVIDYEPEEEGASPRRETFQVSYVTDGRGKTIEALVVRPDGKRRRATFNDNGYPLSDTITAGEPDEVAVLYDRDARTNLVSAVTVRCASADGTPLTLREPAGPGSLAAESTVRELTWRCREAGGLLEDEQAPPSH